MANDFPRPTAFVLAASDHGTMIVSRLDYATTEEGQPYGVGFQILRYGSYEAAEVSDFLFFLNKRRTYFGDGVVAMDCGANIGVHTIEWSKAMTGWGRVVAVEAQERIFYALAGNVAINNCLNAKAIHAAVSSRDGVMRVPQPDYLLPANLGGLELVASDRTEFIGQEIDYSEAGTRELPSLSIDGMGFDRLDLLKIDVEGMEIEVLDGARRTMKACKPIVVVEHIKTGWKPLKKRLTAMGYESFMTPMNLISIHKDDPTLADVKPQTPQSKAARSPRRSRKTGEG